MGNLILGIFRSCRSDLRTQPKLAETWGWPTFVHKKLRFLFQTRKYLILSSTFHTPYDSDKSQSRIIFPHIGADSPTTLHILDSIQQEAIEFRQNFFLLFISKQSVILRFSIDIYVVLASKDFISTSGSPWRINKSIDPYTSFHFSICFTIIHL